MDASVCMARPARFTDLVNLTKDCIPVFHYDRNLLFPQGNISLLYQKLFIS